MSSPDSITSQTEFDMVAMQQATSLPPFVHYHVPLKVIGLMAARCHSDGLSRVVAVAVALGQTHAEISRTERGGKQVGPRFRVSFGITAESASAALPKEAMYDFDRCLGSNLLCKVIDGSPEELGVVLPWVEPAKKPWWRFW